jgi:hypothetical protein
MTRRQLSDSQRLNEVRRSRCPTCLADCRAQPRGAVPVWAGCEHLGDGRGNVRDRCRTVECNTGAELFNSGRNQFLVGDGVLGQEHDGNIARQCLHRCCVTAVTNEHRGAGK